MRAKIFLLLSLALGIAIWYSNPPAGINEQAWHLFAIFAATIFGIVTNAMPIGAVTLMGLAAVVTTGTLTFEEAFMGFHNEVVWLIVLAFFVARGFIKTGLGSRVGYLFMMVLGKRSVGLGYGLCATDLLLAPAIPSATARAGGIILPIVESLSQTYQSYPRDPSSQRIGAYLSLIAVQSASITGGMFLTGMAANPLIAALSAKGGVEISWLTWFSAAIVPGLLNLLALPWCMMLFAPPEVLSSPNATHFAREHLRAMGWLKREEIVMICVFISLLVLWAIGPQIGLKATPVALVGLALLLLSGVLTWKDVITESAAWDTLVWFAILLMMATQLNALGLTDWCSSCLVGFVAGWHWAASFIFLSLLYFYSHYFFASNLAHVGAMFTTFLAMIIALGTPPYLAALSMAFMSSLFGALAQYSCGPAATFFGVGYVPASTFWRVGFLMSIVNLTIWLGVGSLWWKLLGLW